MANMYDDDGILMRRKGFLYVYLQRLVDVVSLPTCQVVEVGGEQINL